MKRRIVDAEEGEEVEQHRPKKITKNIHGQKREYHLLKTVNSLKELDKFRFTNYCLFNGLNRREKENFKVSILPCTLKKNGKGCDFELRAVRPDLKNGTIHVYSFAQHNHPIISEEKRAVYITEKELMPDANPPAIFRTADNSEWNFLQTVPDYGKLQKFQRNSLSHPTRGDEKSWRIRFYCNRRSSCNCNYMWLAVKNTKKGYHVYKRGKHNHQPVSSSRGQTINKNQQSAYIQKNMDEEAQMEEDEEEEGEENQDQEEEEVEDGVVYEEEEQLEDVIQHELGEEEGGSMKVDAIEYPLEKCQRRLDSSLRKEQLERAKKWMRRVERTEIGQIIVEMNVGNVTKLMEMANDDIGISERRVEFWFPWIKQTVRKRGPELQKLIPDFNNLPIIDYLPKKKGKFQKQKARPMSSRRNAAEEDEEEDNQNEIDEDENEEEEKVREDEEDDEEEDDKNDEEEQKQPPPRNISKKMMGALKKYRFLRTVKSMEELDEFRFKNYCKFFQRRPMQILKSRIMPCIRKRKGKTCDFELLAMPSADLDSGEIHVYGYLQHNHPFDSQTRREIFGSKQELIPDANPPAIFVTENNIKLTFLQTITDYNKMEKFRYVNECRETTSDKKGLRIHYYCRCRYSYGCKFKLVAMKTTKHHYHVYKHGEHTKHPTMKPMKDQKEGEEEEDDDGDYEKDEDDEEEGDEEEVEEEDEIEEVEDDCEGAEEVQDENDNANDIQTLIEEENQAAVQREGSAEIEIIEENPSANAHHQHRRFGPKEIHEFHNVGAWLRRKR